MLHANGIIVQELNERTNYVHSFCYEGLNSRFLYPLMQEQDAESRRLSNEQMTRKISEDWYEILEFITDPNLHHRYLKRCSELGIEVRVLFVESEYERELWKGEIPQTKFLGYEYCPIPVDEQIVTDMDWFEGFREHKKKLNEYGLFDAYEDACSFAQEYLHAMQRGKVGDGGLDAYICRVSAVIL